MNWETYIAFGDSITIGARTYLGYPELVGDKLRVELNKEWNVINHAVSSCKAIDLARYIDLHFNSLQTHRASIASILIGTNDIKENTRPEDFRIALNQVVLKTKLLTTNKNVVLFLIPEFHKGVMYPYSLDMNDTIAVFNSHILDVAKAHNIRVLTFEHQKDDFTDGVHLGPQGVESFSDQILKFILKDKGIYLG